MAKWFRSEEMEYVSLIVNEDAAHAAVNDLGMLGVIQFTDVSLVMSVCVCLGCEDGRGGGALRPTEWLDGWMPIEGGRSIDVSMIDGLMND